MLVSRGITLAGGLFVAAALTVQPTPHRATTPRREPLLKRLLRIAGLTAAPSQMKGLGDEVEPGNIWIATIGQQGSRALTRDGGYRSPVFGADGSLYALRGETIVRVPSDGSRARPAGKVSGAAKLVGLEAAGSDEVVVLLDTPAAGSPLASVSLKGGGMRPLPYDSRSEEERRMLAQIRGQVRVYGETTVYTKTETRSGLARPVEWVDVYVRRGGGDPENVSACDGVNCLQPALSPDGRSVVFVKAGD